MPLMSDDVIFSCAYWHKKKTKRRHLRRTQVVTWCQRGAQGRDHQLRCLWWKVKAWTNEEARWMENARDCLMFLRHSASTHHCQKGSKGKQPLGSFKFWSREAQKFIFVFMWNLPIHKCQKVIYFRGKTEAITWVEQNTAVDWLQSCLLIYHPW